MKKTYALFQKAWSSVKSKLIYSNQTPLIFLETPPCLGYMTLCLSDPIRLRCQTMQEHVWVALDWGIMIGIHKSQNSIYTVLI